MGKIFKIVLIKFVTILNMVKRQIIHTETRLTLNKLDNRQWDI